MSQTTQQILSSETEEKSEREQLNEFLAIRRIENEQGYLTAELEAVHTFPIVNLRTQNSRYSKHWSLGRVATTDHTYNSINYVFGVDCYFIAELNLVTRDTTIYALLETPVDLYNVFSDSISISNIIDKEIQVSFPDKVEIKLDDDGVRFRGREKTIPFDTKKSQIVRDNLSVELHPMEDINCFDTEKVLLEPDFFESHVDELLSEMEESENPTVGPISELVRHLKSSSKKIQNELVEHCIHVDRPICATIVECKVDTNATLVVEVEDVIHETVLEFTFDKPTLDTDSDLLSLIDYFDVKSIDELEYQSIKLIQDEPEVDWTRRCNGWYIKPPTSSLWATLCRFFDIR